MYIGVFVLFIPRKSLRPAGSSLSPSVFRPHSVKILNCLVDSMARRHSTGDVNREKREVTSIGCGWRHFFISLLALQLVLIVLVMALGTHLSTLRELLPRRLRTGASIYRHQSLDNASLEDTTNVTTLQPHQNSAYVSVSGSGGMVTPDISSNARSITTINIYNKSNNSDTSTTRKRTHTKQKIKNSQQNLVIPSTRLKSKTVLPNSKKSPHVSPGFKPFPNKSINTGVLTSNFSHVTHSSIVLSPSHVNDSLHSSQSENISVHSTTDENELIVVSGNKSDVSSRVERHASVLFGTTANETQAVHAFQPIDNKQAWFYSAHFDYVSSNKGRPLVRMFGVAHKKYQVKVRCFFSERDMKFSSEGHIHSIPDDHGLSVSPVDLECSILKGARPTHVSITLDPNAPPTNRLLIQYPGPRTRNFTVCYSVLHSEFNKATLLIENIEMNRVLGAEHFYVYNYSISPRVDQVLRQYQHDGVLTVLPWPVPTLQSWYFAQTAALNDCFYRNRNVSRFVVVVDTDEFLVPRTQTSWMELINQSSPEEADVSALLSANSSQKNDKLTPCFVARSSFFYTGVARKEWDHLASKLNFSKQERSALKKYSILTLSQFWRQKLIFPKNVRCKYIARPEMTYYAGVHYVSTFVQKSQKCIYFKEQMAILNHYRFKGASKSAMVDANVSKFNTQLYPRVLRQIKRFLHMS